MRRAGQRHYDYDGQLTSITQGSNMTSFAYDALGRRISRTAGGVTTQFLSSGSQVWLEKQGNTTTATYTYGNALVRKDGEYPLFDRFRQPARRAAAAIDGLSDRFRGVAPAARREERIRGNNPEIRSV
jgi:YD repeat-containing protein